jgi:hypothetical protein
MTDRFRHTIDETDARREAAREALRRMREAIERSRELLRESGEQLEPPGGDDGAESGESAE